MIGPPDIDDALETAFELLLMVGDVGSEIRRLAVGADDDPVLLVTQFGCAKPRRTVLDIEMPVSLKASDSALDCPAVLEFFFMASRHSPRVSG